jgi:hypothetical protein
MNETASEVHEMPPEIVRNSTRYSRKMRLQRVPESRFHS